MDDLIYWLTLYFVFNLWAAIVVAEDMWEQQYSKLEIVIAFILCTLTQFVALIYSYVEFILEQPTNENNKRQDN